MRKSFCIIIYLLCFTVNGYAQDITFSELIEIKSKHQFEDFMYSKGIRFISQHDIYSLWTARLGEWSESEKKYDVYTDEYISSYTEMPEITSEYYKTEIFHGCRFGKNYNSKDSTASVFYDYGEESLFYNWPHIVGKYWDLRDYKIYFVSKSDFDRFWESIDHPVYIETHHDRFTTREYSFNENITIFINEWDGGQVNVRIKHNQFYFNSQSD
jgi:hypothetical protein